MRFVEVLRIEEWSPSIWVNSWKVSDRLALFNNVWTQRPLKASIIRSEHWGSDEAFDPYQSGPGKGAIVFEQLILIYLLGWLIVIVANMSVICFFVSVGKTDVDTAQQVRPKISDTLKHLSKFRLIV